MPSSTILITGVSGFIGFRTLLLALESGHHVRAVIRTSSQIPKLQSHPLILPHLNQLNFVVIPDLTQSKLFDSFLEGVTGILNLTSPLAIETTDYERDIVQPAIDVTNSVLEAAARHAEVKRVVITSSAVTLIPFEWLSNPNHDRIYSEKDLNTHPTREFNSSMEAYWASKALSRTTTHQYLFTHRPHFQIINLLPTVVIGPDALATSTATLLSGTRALALAPILGQIMPPLVGVSVHVDDVARAHVDALRSDVRGDADYVLTSDGIEGMVWDDGKEVVKGVKGAKVLRMDGGMNTVKWRVDASATDKAFGWKCRSFEVTIRDLVEQYLGLLERENTGQ